MKIKIHHTGHAGFAIQVNNLNIVLDHWSSSYRPFEGSWQKLEKDDFNDEIKRILCNPDFVWCSHEHGDHFDPTYLNSLESSEVRFIVPEFEDGSLVERFSQYGIDSSKCLMVGDMQELVISDDIKISMLFEEPAYSNHSSIILSIGSVNILHNADTTPNKRFYEKVNDLNIGDISVFIGQYCNPTPYPWVIEMDAPKKEHEAFEMHLAAIETHINMCNVLEPKWTIPCAGPALVDSFKVQEYKRINEFVYDKKRNLDEIRKGLKKTKIIDLCSGDLFELDG